MTVPSDLRPPSVSTFGKGRHVPLRHTVDTEAVRLARVGLRRLGLVGASEERDRRPTDGELERLFAHFGTITRANIPMTRLVQFAIATAMRIEEVCRIEWETLDPRTRTILVPDRKDPRKKTGNHQRVPLPLARKKWVKP